MASSFEKLKSLNLSRDEVDRLGNALKNEEFRKLLTDYVEELQDPENKKQYEAEIKELERERGNEVTFLHPTPGYVLKTSLDGQQKCFINICANENVAKPSSSATVKDGAKGLQWQVPHSSVPPREDIDNKGVRCQVFDVIYHPDTLHLSNKNTGFRNIVNTTAIEAVESNFNVTLDKKNIKFPKLNYKGVPKVSVIRKATSTAPERSDEEKAFYNKLFAEADSINFNNSKQKENTINNKKHKNINTDDGSAYTTPKYVIKHRTHVDIQDFTFDKDAKTHAAMPKELFIEIDLPLLKSSNDMDLDVTEKTVQLVSEKPAKYKLSLTLPYQVIESSGTAKFDKDLKKLNITLPVKHIRDFNNREDSGVESDCNTTPSIQAFESEDEQLSGVDETSDVVSSDVRTFLDTTLHYELPEFTCNIFENTVAFTFCVKNVDESTVVSKCIDNNSIHIKFTSISSSYYPNHYAFFVKFKTHDILESKLSTEVWDNNVILQIPLTSISDCNVEFASYHFGINSEELCEKFLEEPQIINQQLSPQEIPNSKHLTPVTVEPITKAPIPPIKSRAIDILDTSYESSGDELSYGSFSPRKCRRGILKRMVNGRAGMLGRSVSESSLDDFICSSMENTYGMSLDSDIPEDHEMSTSLKKTVRFNDVVSKQLYRSNSSILGQKKKNQRKTRNKKRAHDRRHSESEVSDSDNRTKPEDAKDDNIVINEACGDAKRDDQIFHLEINN